MKNWINTLSQHFKVPTSVALGLLTDETYSLDDAQCRRPPAQYVQAIMRHGIDCNINDISNQLSFAYQGLAPELRVFVSSPTESTKAAKFIHILEEKQENWFEMMTTGTSFHRPYHCLRMAYSPSRFNSCLPLVTQSDAFARYQAQQSPYPGYSQDFSLNPWKQPDRHNLPQPFRQTFQP